MVIDGCKDKYQERARRGAEMTTEKLCRRWAGSEVGGGGCYCRGGHGQPVIRLCQVKKRLCSLQMMLKFNTSRAEDKGMACVRMCVCVWKCSSHHMLADISVIYSMEEMKPWCAF